MGLSEKEQAQFERESPQHWVTIRRGFWLFDTPCTQSLWEALTGQTPSRFSGSMRPVEKVSWHDCQEFVQRLNEQVLDVNLRLPTEAEWEYSCRAGNADARYGELSEVAWFAGNSESQTHEVKGKEPNQWGLHDMLGNVWEWCADNAYRPYSTDAETDPNYQTEAGADRVVRGGGWSDPAQFVRAAYRSAIHPGGRFDYLGFRCLSSSEPSQ